MEVNRLNKAERAAYEKLKELEAIWPDSLWLFSAAGSLWLMKKLRGECVMTDYGGFDQARVVGESIVIENDGGDW